MYPKGDLNPHAHTEQQILSLSCLPFQHSGIKTYYKLYKYNINLFKKNMMHNVCAYLKFYAQKTIKIMHC